MDKEQRRHILDACTVRLETDQKLSLDYLILLHMEEQTYLLQEILKRLELPETKEDEATTETQEHTVF